MLTEKTKGSVSCNCRADSQPRYKCMADLQHLPVRKGAAEIHMSTLTRWLIAITLALYGLLFVWLTVWATIFWRMT